MTIFGTQVFLGNSTQSIVPSIATPSFNTAKGDLLTVVARWNVITATCAITDDAGNVYTPLTRNPNLAQGSAVIQMFYCIGAKARPVNTITAKFSTASPFVFIGAWDTPLTGIVMFDTEKVSLGTSGNSVSSGSFTTRGTDEIIFAAASPNVLAQTVAAGAGYTSDSTSIGASGFGGASHLRSSTPGSQSTSFSWATSASSEMVVGAFSLDSGTGYSVPDCRDYATFPNTPVDVQGTLQYTVPTHPSHPNPVDSRTSVPVDSRETPNIPFNSRTFPPFEG